MIVADASALLEVLLRTETGLLVESRLFRDGETIHAPALVDVEIAQVLRRYVTAGAMTAARGRLALDTIERFPMDRYSHEPLLKRIWELRDNVTAYDAAYVALAEALRAPLITCDAKLAKAPLRKVSVELIR
jgi:predicted nucleic acid-binding protein